MIVRVAQILAATTVACAAAVAAAPAASAGCYGTVDTAELCVYPERATVDPDGGPYVGDCVYDGDSDCRDVGTNIPSVTSSGPLAEVH